MTDYKQTIVVRKDLKMRRGKEIAQASHAVTQWLIAKIRSNSQFTDGEDAWIKTGMTKICLQVNSEEELLNVYKLAQEAKLPAYLITDSGKTEFNGVPTITCLAIGPSETTRIDKITSHLNLY